MTTAVSADARRDELVERLFGSALGAMDLLCVYLGDRLGMYRALVDTGAATSAELASVAGVDERYAREWLEQQAMAGILEVQDPIASDAERRYAVPPGHDEVLLDEGGLNNMAPMAQLLVACALPIHAVLARSEPATGCRTPITAPTSTRARPASPSPCSTTSSRPTGFPRCRPSTIASWRSPRARRRRRVRARPVEHRDRPRIPQGHGRRDRPRPGLDRAGPAAPARKRCRRPCGVPPPGRRGSRALRSLRPRDDLRGAARHVVPG